MKTYIIKNQKDLDKFKDDYGYKIDGNAEFKYSAFFEGRLLVDGYLYIKAGESIKAGGYIEAGWYIKAGGSIEAGGYIKAGGYIEAGGYIKAGGYIEAGGSIEAGGYIKAGGYIEAGDYYGISAGLSITCKGKLSLGLKAFAGICTWREITDEEKTITCGEFDGGVVEYGILKETGLPEEKMITLSNGKKVSESTVIEALRALTN
jgi:hypothetical protein